MPFLFSARSVCGRPPKAGRHAVLSSYSYISVSYKCKYSGFIRANGNKRLRCNRQKKRWKGTPLSCRSEAIDNIIYNIVFLYFYDTTLLSYFCKDIYFIYFVNIIERAKCRGLGRIRNGFWRTCGGMKVGAIAVAYCRDGFVLVGERVLTCTSSGIWSHPLPKCIAGENSIPCYSVKIAFYNLIFFLTSACEHNPSS